MDKMDRRGFLRIVGVGFGAVAAGTLMPVPGLLSWNGRGESGFSFRAVAGLPSGRLPSYATWVVQGSVGLDSRSGVITETLFAGDPEATSTIAFPGMSRVVRVTDVRQSGDVIEVSGVIDDASQLRRGESPDVGFRVDRSTGVAEASFLGTQVRLQIAE